MGLIDAGTVDFLLSFKLVRTDEDGERTLAFLIFICFAPGNELLLRFLEVGAEDFPLVILLDDAVDFGQCFGKLSQIHPSLCVVINGSTFRNRIRFAHVVNDGTGFYLSNLRPVAIRTYLAQLLRL